MFHSSKDEIKTVEFKVHGMTCSHCTNRVKKVIKDLSGVKKVSISLDSVMVSAMYSQNDVDMNTIKDAIVNAGYEVL